MRRESEPSLTIHPEDAAARGIADGPDGAHLQRPRLVPGQGARLGRRAARAWWSGLSIWWAKMCPGGRNANAVTSQELTDMGGGATFYDALVEVAPA